MTMQQSREEAHFERLIQEKVRQCKLKLNVDFSASCHCCGFPM